MLLRAPLWSFAILCGLCYVELLCCPLRSIAVFSHTRQSLLVLCLCESVGRAWGCIMFRVYIVMYAERFCNIEGRCGFSTDRVYSTQPDSQFLSVQASMPYIRRHWASHVPSTPPAGHNRFCRYSDRCGAFVLYCLLSDRLYSGTIIAKCNGLWQFNEDTGKLFVPVRESNLSMPASIIELKTLCQTWIWTELSASQPSRHCGLLLLV